MPIVKPDAELHSPALQKLAELFNETLGFCPNSILTMQKKPELAEAFVSLNIAVMKNNGSITSEQKRLFAFLSSSTTGCRYCQAHTLLAAERYGASKERLENIWDFENQDCYTESEKAAFRFVIAASKVPVAVTEDIESEMKTYWSDNQIVEIMGVVALFGYLNRWNDVMGTTLEDAAVSFASKNIKNWSIGKHSS
ncbi:MAG: carboxymuconolactone decarboxylase family protein [Gammaproteobacteria bacterium]|jgi:uncharacterized peroxidase-related enzyme